MVKSGNFESHIVCLTKPIHLGTSEASLCCIVLQVEFAGGALKCGEHITVRKISDSSQKVFEPTHYNYSLLQFLNINCYSC